MFPSSVIYASDSKNIEFIEKNIALPEIFNKDGVFRVFTQIIISIFSLNTREGGSLNEVGKMKWQRMTDADKVNTISSYMKNGDFKERMRLTGFTDFKSKFKNCAKRC